MRYLTAPLTFASGIAGVCYTLQQTGGTVTGLHAAILVTTALLTLAAIGSNKP